MDMHQSSISDAEHYGQSAPIRLRCAHMILETFEKLRGRPIDKSDRVLDLGCGLRGMLDSLWGGGGKNPGYVLGLDVDFGEEISKDIRGSDWSFFNNWETEEQREFVLSDALKWNPPAEGKQFSVIYSGSALHWIVAGAQQPDAAESGMPVNGKALFDKVSKALQPGGWFVAHSPGCENFYPLFTRIIIAALNDIKEHLGCHHDADVAGLSSLPDIREWINNKENQSEIENNDAFAGYWKFRRKAGVAFWKDYSAILQDINEPETNLEERLLLRGLDWELVSTEVFYSHWASAGKSVFWGRFRAVAERSDGAGCALYDEFERAFKSILEDDAKLKSLGVSPLYIDGKKYIRHYCHRYYIVLQKSDANGGTKHIDVSPLTSLPIKIAYDVATASALPPFKKETNEKSEFDGEGLAWLRPFRSLKDCLPDNSMKYGMFLREGRSDGGLGKSLKNTDRRALLQRVDSLDAKWQYKIDEFLGSDVKVAQFTSMRTIAENALPVCVVVGSKEQLPDRISEMMAFTHSQHRMLKETGTPVFIVASTTNPRINSEEPPATLDAYRNLLDGATGNEVREPVSFMFYSSESVYEELRQIENEDVGALSILRALRWHGSIAFPCAFVLGHTAPPEEKARETAVETVVRFASASILLALNKSDTTEKISFADLALIGSSLRIMSLWDQVAAERDLRKRIAEASTRSALAAIMARNMSHNIGSHVLSQIDESAMGDKQDMQTLHAYLQRRMDLVARITSRYPDWGEPLWFFGDLLRGFLAQTILLNHLVKDQGGWCKDKIKFLVKVEEVAKEVTYKEKAKDDAHDSGWLTSLDEILEGNDIQDFLISSPDGAIGAQAFYILLEGLMRNSAKYGRADPKPPCFEIHLELTEKGGYYELAIWDNLSICPQPGEGEEKLCVKLQGGIKTDLTDKQGQLNTESLGIAEMREACGFLIHPYGADYAVAPVKAGCEEDACACHQTEQEADTHDDRKFPLWVECCKPNGGEEYLKYRLHLAKPKMVGIAGLGEKNLVAEASGLGIVKLADKDELLGLKGAYQFAIIVVDDGIAELEKWIESNRAFLPQRLLLVTESPVITEKAPCFGRRAIACISEEVGLENILLGGNGDREKCEAFIRKVYETWLTKRWPEELECGIRLNITLERTVLSMAWEQVRKSSALSSRAEIAVYPIINGDKSRNENGVIKRGNNNDGAIEGGACTVIDYSNHSDKDPDNKTKILVKFSNGDKTFETLFMPPSTPFAMDWLLLGLIESALAKVVILDERVAIWACKKGENVSRVEDCQLARVWTIFKISSLVKDGWLTGYLEECCTKDTDVSHSKADEFCLPVWVIEETAEVYGFARRKEAIPPCISDADFVVVHIGVAETVGAAVQGVSAGKFMETGYSVAPSVIMTSGRGGAANQRAGCALPFIEYSTIREYFVHNVAKYQLVRTLMSTKVAQNT